MTARIGLALLIAAAGCTTTTTDDPAAGATDTRLVISETATGIEGSLGDTTFTSMQVDEQTLDITVKINAMVLTATADLKAGVLELDGYSAATGEDTQMTDEDRASLVELEGALAPLGEDVPYALDKLRGFVATIAEHPTTLDLQTLRLLEENRSWTSLCYAKNTYYPATHDCNVGNMNIDATTLDDAYLSSQGSQGSADGTAWYFPAGGGYQCCSGSMSCSRYTCNIPAAGWYVNIEVDHDTRVEYAYGNCFGVCGAGCPGTYQFTVDCVNHDACVRNGHVTASAYCDDQFTAASDDWVSAPNCGA